MRIRRVTEPTEAERTTIKASSAYGLSDEPSAAGMSAAEIKAAFWKPVVETSDSMFKLVDRLASEVNTSLYDAEIGIDRCSEESASARSSAEAAVISAETAAVEAQSSAASAEAAETAAESSAASAASAAADAYTAISAADTAAAAATAAADLATEKAELADGKAQDADEAAAAATAAADLATEKAELADGKAQDADEAATAANTAAELATAKAALANSKAQDADEAATAANTAAVLANAKADLADSKAQTADTAAAHAETAADSATAAAALAADAAANIAGNISNLENVLFTKTQITSEGDVNAKIELASSAGSAMIYGTRNVVSLLNIIDGTFTINGLTITVNGTSVIVNGTASKAFYYSLSDGEEKTKAQLQAMTCPLPAHGYTLSALAYDGTSSYHPSFGIADKQSSSAFVTVQNNVATFASDTNAGGAYLYFTNGRSYDFEYKLAIFPYTATAAHTYRDSDSSVTKKTADGKYDVNGYLWYSGNPSLYAVTEKIKRPMCVYSTRSIPYSTADRIVDIYVPAKNGYIDYIFAHTCVKASDQVIYAYKGSVETSGDLPSTNLQIGDVYTVVSDHHDVVWNGSEWAAPKTVLTADVWRLLQIAKVSDYLKHELNVTALGETEMAVKIVGRNDFIGGSTHGDEYFKAFRCLLDGKETDLTTVTSLTEFDLLEFVQVTEMYDPADGVTKVGEHGVNWIFDRNGLQLTQNVVFLQSLMLENSYMPMICANRVKDGVQVTDTYIDDTSFAAYDVSEEGFTGYPYTPTDQARSICLYGSVSGVEIKLEIVKQSEGLLGQGSHVSNLAAYNKIYNALCGYPAIQANQQSVNNGDRWYSKTRIAVWS